MDSITDQEFNLPVSQCI